MICPRCSEETEVVEGLTWCCGFRMGRVVYECDRCHDIGCYVCRKRRNDLLRTRPGAAA